MYTINLEIYTGTQPYGPYSLSNSPGDIVKHLSEVVKGTYRNITMDNWFSSFPLASDLNKNFKLTMLGTLKKNKRETPPDLFDIKDRNEKSSLFAFHNAILVSFIPKKKKMYFSFLHPMMMTVWTKLLGNHKWYLITIILNMESMWWSKCVKVMMLLDLTEDDLSRFFLTWILVE